MAVLSIITITAVLITITGTSMGARRRMDTGMRAAITERTSLASLIAFEHIPS
jgi:hypothetical protein